jgi:ribosomal protein S18 acetylase RimI-like enzyme
MIVVRVLAEQDWQEWREMRLAALAESPSAYSSTLAEWAGEGDVEERWRSRLRSVALNLVADLGDLPAGMTSATAPADGDVELISMWVVPELRGRGVGDALIEAVVAWAFEQGAARVGLDVRKANHQAVALYRRNGFRDVVAGPVPRGMPPEQRMVRELLAT